VAPISNISLVLLLVLMLGTNISEVLGLLGSGAILAMLLMVVVAVVAGYFLGGPGTDTKRVLALGTGQRNLAATFVVATGNFAAQPEVLIFLTAAGLVGMLILFPIAAEFGKRSRGGAAQAKPEAKAAN
jgi:BASS family bile acid:Na+ symporter